MKAIRRLVPRTAAPRSPSSGGERPRDVVEVALPFVEPADKCPQRYLQGEAGSRDAPEIPGFAADSARRDGGRRHRREIGEARGGKAA